MTDSEQSKLIISGAVAANSPSDEAQDEADSSVELELRRVMVPAGSHGARLDRALAGIVPEFSRSYLQQLIEAAVVQLNGRAVTKPSAKVKAGDELIIELRPTPQSQAFKPEAMALDIVFEDPYLLVIDKPAGLVVHPAPGNWSGTLLNGLLARDPQASFLPRAGIVHRLDKDTSGLMVVARQRQAMDQLVSMIAARSVSREYIALAHGAWQGARTREVSAAIGRDPRNRLRMAAVDLEKNAGKPALTVISLLQNGERHCLVKCKLHTGRTHQIRVHMALLGHPLISDGLYGGAVAAGLERQALHACRLAFEHPVTGAPMEFRSPPPPDLRAAIADVGLIYNQSS
ncbi:RluA family pseudouridine synthase [Polaromonas sp. JS666]|uniref:RluA family pseudouridine synthase n=1 Tax=Polaromonas sp. (strain JS666 / ATCC BAA-500) TaxID=296591 RepID=UPI0000D5B3E8|nr:RluA family pseudouridine synthase [Polaromonas sp. JS666]ABE44531.1 ribosomal large subunit pseudouridine synthase D [Polaromonas sp. JS666]